MKLTEKRSYAPRVVEAENVNEAYFTGLNTIREHGTPLETRNGPATKLPGVLVTNYRQPQQRMILVRERDANPFFHLFESLSLVH